MRFLKYSDFVDREEKRTKGKGRSKTPPDAV
jgi:predicted transcriptional regulator